MRHAINYGGIIEHVRRIYLYGMILNELRSRGTVKRSNILIVGESIRLIDEVINLNDINECIINQ